MIYVLSLIGSEGFLLDLGGLNTFWKKEDIRKIVVSLLGRIKGEKDDRWHLLPCVKKTSSGINAEKSVERLKNLKAKQEFLQGPAISDK